MTEQPPPVDGSTGEYRGLRSIFRHTTRYRRTVAPRIPRLCRKKWDHIPATGRQNARCHQKLWCLSLVESRRLQHRTSGDVYHRQNGDHQIYVHRLTPIRSRQTVRDSRIFERSGNQPSVSVSRQRSIIPLTQRLIGHRNVAI